MDLSLGTTAVPTSLTVSQDASFTKASAGQNPLAMPRAIQLTAKLGHDVLLPTSFFQQIKTLSHFVARTRLQPLTNTKTDREDNSKRRATFIRSVIINKSEATGNRNSQK